MPIQNIICISIDGLRASALGAYGNTWHPTPALDVLASESIVYDWMFCERPSLDGFFSTVWRDGDASFAQRLASAGVQTALTTDDREIAEQGERSGFGEVRQLEFIATQSAATVADTELAQLFAVAIDQLAGWAERENASGASISCRLLWLHARGFYGAWDAPLEFRESLLDEDDPEAPTFVSPPSVAGVTEHDELLLYRVAYAGQTMVLDECIGALSAALVDFELRESTLVLLTAPQGYALGEHGAVGEAATALYGERVHVPCLLRFPGAPAPPARRTHLVQTRDLYATLLHAAGAGDFMSAGYDLLSSEAAAGRQFVVCTGGNGEAVIRTPAWMLRRAPREASDHRYAQPVVDPAVELYFKPDDRWEVNEIASRAPDAAERLLAALGSAVRAGDSQAGPAALDDDLVAHPR